MPDLILISFFSLLTLVFQYEPGTYEFYVVSGATLLVFLCIAHLLVGLFESTACFIYTLFAMAVPLVFGCGAYLLIELYVLPQIDAAWASVYLPWVGFGLLVLGGLWGISKRVLSLNFALCIVILVLSSGAGAVTYYGSQMILDFMNASSGQFEKHEAQTKQEIEGVVQ